MTAFKLDPDEPSRKPAGIKHKCLRRKSQRTYELLDPKRPGDVVSFDVGQIKMIVEMDRKLREDRVVTSIPAGYFDFAARFNEYATGPERFATISYVRGNPETCTAGSPVVWEQFMIDDYLVGWDFDSSSREPAALSSSIPGVSHHGLQISPSDSVGAGKVELPQLRALSAHMKGALETTDQLAQFWIQRGAIEHDYASRLAKLAERPIGEREPSEFRDAIDGFRVEAARQAINHNSLAMQIAIKLETRCVDLQFDQATHLREVYEPGVKKLEEMYVEECEPQTGISAEWKRQYRNVRHSLDLTRLQAMKKSMPLPFHATSRSSAEHFDINLRRESDYVRESSARTKEWRTLLRSCQKVEKVRSQFMKELLSAFTDILASLRRSKDDSYETIIRTCDLFRPQEVLEEFLKNFGTEGENQSYRNLRSRNIEQSPGQERTPTQPNTPLPRPLPRLPGSITTETNAPLFHIKIAGKETGSLESGNIVAISTSSDGNPCAAQLFSTHDKNAGKCAIPRTPINGEAALSGPRPRSTAINRSSSLALRPSISRSISLAGRSDMHLPVGAPRHDERLDTLPKTNLPLPQALPGPRRKIRPTLPKLDTQLDSKPPRKCW